jgi:hypothetical protein
MSHRHHGRQRRTHREPGIAVAAACDDCAHLIGSPEPSEDGIRMGIVHIGHVAEFEDLGWVLTYPDGPGEPPDITCEHYHQANWQGGHSGCCGGRDPGGPGDGG